MRLHYLLEEEGSGMGTVFEIEATITDRGQTTVPAAVRKMLGLGKRGAVVFRGLSDGSVVIAPKEVEAEDPALAGFLAFLERDMIDHPDGLVPLSQDLLDRTDALIGDVDVDLDAPLTDD